jgi:hypothetical protein
MQIYNATTAEFEALSLDALRSLLTVLYPEPTPVEPSADEAAMQEDGEAAPSERPAVKGIVADICEHGLSELQEADKSNAKAATKVLALMITISSAHAD